MNLRCIRHGELNPEKSPELSCKVCCKLFVTAIKERQSNNTNKRESGLIGRWLEDRNRAKVAASNGLRGINQP